MPRYYFHLRDHSERLLDPAGQDIRNPEDIPAIALREVRGVISQDAIAGVIDLTQRLEVEDQYGEVVYSLPFEEAVQVKSVKQ